MSCRNDTVSVSYTSKDLILYALSIGFGSKSDFYEEDLCHVFEGHPRFQAFPTFCAALTFLANGCTTCLPQFPPPLMKQMGILPSFALRQPGIDVDEFPVLHTYTSIVWDTDLPTPGQDEKATLEVQGKFTHIIPKSVGTFVTSDTGFYSTSNVTQANKVCSIKTTYLILGLDRSLVIPFNATDHQQSFMDEVIKGKLFFETITTIPPNQALLYRIGSGDTNAIHVDPAGSPMLSDNGRPVLHGLCTLGIVAREIVQHLRDNGFQNISLRQLQCRFVKPLFLEETIQIKCWHARSSTSHGELPFLFVVENKSTNNKRLMVQGLAILHVGGDAQRKHHARL